MNKSRRSSVAKAIIHCIGIYLLALFFFELCYWHTMDKLAKGFIWGTCEFLWETVFAGPQVFIWRFMMMVYLIVLEVVGLKIGCKICSTLNLRGVLAVVIGAACVFGATLLIDPIMSLVQYVLNVVGTVIFTVVIALSMIFGSFGAILILTGLTRSDLNGDQRFALVALGSIWKKIDWENEE